jgi:hypothetical protein
LLHVANFKQSAQLTFPSILQYILKKRKKKKLTECPEQFAAYRKILAIFQTHLSFDLSVILEKSKLKLKKSEKSEKSLLHVAKLGQLFQLTFPFDLSIILKKMI